MQDADRSWLTVPAGEDAPAGSSLFELLRARPVLVAALAGTAAVMVVLAGLALTVTAAAPRIDLTALGSAGASPLVDSSPGAGAQGGIVVDVAGAVRRPGLYHLAAGSRIGDAIQAAGGFAPAVDAALVARDLNLAAALTDGQKIVVPQRGAVTGSAAASGGSTSSAGGLVDLNHASESELDALPGIGPVTAKKIIDSRAQTPFTDARQLLDRKLVGQKTWEKLRDLVTVG